MRTPRGGISGRATSIGLGIGARSDRTDDVTIAMKLQPEPSAQEVLAGLVERVTYHNAENGFCVLRAACQGTRPPLCRDRGRPFGNHRVSGSPPRANGSTTAPMASSLKQSFCGLRSPIR